MKVKLILFSANVAVIAVLIVPGCSARLPHDKNYISDSIEERTRFGLATKPQADTLAFPPGINPDDGITEEEAVAIALWNNAQFQADLVELGVARADLIETGLLRNPVFSLLFPLGPKQLEATLNLPVEVLWQRPSRVTAAKLNSQKVAENLVQHGLALVRDVKIAFATFFLARDKFDSISEEVKVRDEIARLASSRFNVGDISELEEIAFLLNASQSKEISIRYARDTELEGIRLCTLIGIVPGSAHYQFSHSPLTSWTSQDSSQLLKTALAARPEMRAAELDIEAAAHNLGWERSKIVNLTAILDANGEGKEGFEAGPGLQLTVPLFNWNQGGTARARAQMEGAARRYVALQQSIRKEVLESYHTYLAAVEVLDVLQNDILPPATRAVAHGEKAYLAGDISYLEFLEFKRQLLEARLRFAEAEAEVRRSMANLFCAAGGKPF